jgi:hypothetical protein
MIWLDPEKIEGILAWVSTMLFTTPDSKIFFQQADILINDHS